MASFSKNCVSINLFYNCGSSYPSLYILASIGFGAKWGRVYCGHLMIKYERMVRGQGRSGSLGGQGYISQVDSRFFFNSSETIISTTYTQLSTC